MQANPQLLYLTRFVHFQTLNSFDNHAIHVPEIYMHWFLGQMITNLFGRQSPQFILFPACTSPETQAMTHSLGMPAGIDHQPGFTCSIPPHEASIIVRGLLPPNEVDDVACELQKPMSHGCTTRSVAYGVFMTKSAAFD